MPSPERRLNVRLSASDHEALARTARASGLTVSDFVRRRCLEDDGRPRIIVDTETLKRLYVTERKLGGLLNQLLRHANERRQDFPELASEAESLLRQLSDSTTQISNFIAEAKASA